MSAYIVDRGTIAYLVEAGRHFDTASSPLIWSKATKAIAGSCGAQAVLVPGMMDPAEVGQMLWDENIRSIEYRYPDTVASKDYPGGPCGDSLRYSEHRVPPFRIFTVPQVIMTAKCFAYQACETNDWERSEAHSYIEALKSLAVESLAHAEGTQWGAPSNWVEYCRLTAKEVQA
jgi:hypothetical protein